MRTFRCDHCGHPLFFENVQCLQCGSTLAFLPDRLALCAIEPVPGDVAGLWQRKTLAHHKPDLRRYRPCSNHIEYQACNFVVRSGDPNPLCASCRQTRVLPDLSIPRNHERWYRIEVAKRRLFYTLAKLRLVSVDTPDGRTDGPVFDFLAELPGQRVVTGHCQGLITLNIAEADDDERVRTRLALHEPYRTLLGHLRHESGHFYWDRLVLNGRIDEFRSMFGDERINYDQALQNYYAAGGAPTDWQLRFVSAYATAHPWEDWAETWAHYLHMVDLMETASSYNTRVVIPGTRSQNAEEVTNPFDTEHGTFDELVQQWVPLTLLLNSLNRSLGQDDAYPFALTAGALEKLRFVHEVIHAPRESMTNPQGPSCQLQDGPAQV